MTDVDVTLAQVLRAAKQRVAPVTPETAGYIVLGILDAVGAAPAVVKESNVVLSSGGLVTAVGLRRGSTPAACERSVRILLLKLLSVAVGSAPALVTCARRSGTAGLDAFLQEIEAALIPVNRSAAKRAIARLAREASKVAGAVGAEAGEVVPEPVPERKSRPPARKRAPEPRAPVPDEPPPAGVVTNGTLAPALPAAIPEPVEPAQLTATPLLRPPIRPAPPPSPPKRAVPREQRPAGVATNGNRSGRQSTEVDEHGGTPREVNVGGEAPSLAPALPALLEAATEPEYTAPPPTPAPPPTAPVPDPPPPPPPLEASLDLTEVDGEVSFTPQLASYDPHPGASSTPVPRAATGRSPIDPEPFLKIPRSDQTRPLGAVAPRPGTEAVGEQDARELAPAPSPEGDVPPVEVMSADDLSPVEFVEVDGQTGTPLAELGWEAVEAAAALSPAPAPARGKLERTPPLPLGPDALNVGEQSPSLAVDQPEEQATPAADAGAAIDPSPALALPLGVATNGGGTPRAVSVGGEAPSSAPALPGEAEGPADAVSAEADANQPREKEEQAEGPDRVNELLASFSSQKERSAREVSGDLKRMVGLEPTPAPTGEMGLLAAQKTESEVATEPPAADLLEPVEFTRPRAPRTGLFVVMVLLGAALCVAAAIYWYYPSFFLGR